MTQELITEKVITYIYQHYNQKLLKQLEADFLDKTDVLAYQFSDWLVYDYPVEKQQCFGTIYLREAAASISEGEVEYIKNRISSYLSFYEAIKIKDGFIQLKNIFATETIKINKEALEEDINLHEILLARFTQGDQPQLISNSVTVLPHQFKTLLMGQIHEDFELVKGRKQFLTIPQYFKENLVNVLGIVNKLLSYKDQEGDVTLYQSIYAISDYQKVKEILLSLKDMIRREDDGIYQLMEADLLLAEIVLQRNLLEVECSNKEDQSTAKKILAEKLEGCILHLKDEELSIDDLI